MTKKFTVTGSSSTRPTGLPAGFEVEETEERFERRIGASNDEDIFAFKLTREYGSLAVRITQSVRDGDDRRVFVKTEQVVKLRDALTEYLDDEPNAPTAPAVVRLGDPEPPRDARYVEQDGSVWRYGNGGWSYYSGDTRRRSWDMTLRSWPETFPWTLKAD